MDNGAIWLLNGEYQARLGNGVQKLVNEEGYL